MGDPSPFAYPGVAWDDIARYVTVCIVTNAVAVLLALVRDFFDARTVASRRPKQLRSYGAKRWQREELRIRMAFALHPTRSTLGRLLEAIDAWAGLAMLCLYWQSTYFTSSPTYRWSAVVIFLNAYFVAHWLLRVIMAPQGQRLAFVLSLQSILNIVALVCALMTATGAVNTYMTLAFVRVFCVYFTVDRLLKQRAGQFRCSRVQLVGVRVMLLISSYIVTMAGTMATIERAGDLPGWDFLVGADWELINALYFSVVTVATVGFGDIAPQTALGRLFICVFIISGAITFSRVAAALLEVYQEPHAGLGVVRNPTGRLLVLLTGSPDRRQLCDVLDELFHPAHPNAAYLHVVSLLEGSNFSEDDFRWFEESPHYGPKLSYLRGSVFDVRDLERAAPGSTTFTGDTSRLRLQAVFVLSARGTEDEDTQNQLRAMALRRFLPHGAEIYVLLGSGESLHSLMALGIPAERILARDIVKSGFLAANAATPGAGTLLVNLFSSDGGAAGSDDRLGPPRVLSRGFGAGFSWRSQPTVSLNPEWLSQRVVWRAERTRRCFPPLPDNAVFSAMTPDHPVHAVVPMGGGGKSRKPQSEVLPWSLFTEIDTTARPAWHADYKDGLEQELFQLSMPPFLADTTLLEATVILFATPLTGLLSLPPGDPDKVAPPSSWEELLFTLATHPSLHAKQGPILVGTPATVKASKASRIQSSQRVHSGQRQERIYCNLHKKYTMRRGEGSILVLLRDRKVLPRLDDIEAVGLRALVLGLLWEFCLRSNIELPGRSRAYLEARVARAAGIGNGFGGMGNGDSIVRSVAWKPATIGRGHSSLRAAEKAESNTEHHLARTLATSHAGNETRAKLPTTWLARLPSAPSIPSSMMDAGTATRPGLAIPSEPTHSGLRITAPRTRSALVPITKTTKASVELSGWPALPVVGTVAPAGPGTATPVLTPAAPTFILSPSVRIPGSNAPPFERRASFTDSLNQVGRTALGSPRGAALRSPSRRFSAIPSSTSIPAFVARAAPSSVPMLPVLITGRIRRNAATQRQPPDAPCAPPAGLVGHIVILLDDLQQREQLPRFLQSLALLTEREVVIVCTSAPGSWLPQLRTKLTPAPTAYDAQESTAEEPSVKFASQKGVSKITTKRHADVQRPSSIRSPFVYAIEGNALTPESFDHCRLEYASRVVVVASSMSSAGANFAGPSKDVGVFGKDEWRAGELSDWSRERVSSSSTDVRGCLITLLLESWLVNRKPALLQCITTELSIESSYRMLGPVPVPERAQKSSKPARAKQSTPKTPLVPLSVAPAAQGPAVSSLPSRPALMVDISVPESAVLSPSRLVPRSSFVVLTLGGLWPLQPVEEDGGDGDEVPDGGWAADSRIADDDDATARHDTPHGNSSEVDLTQLQLRSSSAQPSAGGSGTPSEQEGGHKESAAFNTSQDSLKATADIASTLHRAAGPSSEAATGRLESGIVKAGPSSVMVSQPFSALGSESRVLVEERPLTTSRAAPEAPAPVSDIRRPAAPAASPVDRKPTGSAKDTRATESQVIHTPGLNSAEPSVGEIDERWGDSLGFKFSPRFAAGRLIPDSFVSKLLVQGYFNPSLLRLAHMFSLGDQVQVHRMRLPPGSLSLSNLLCKCPHHTEAAVTVSAPKQSTPASGTRGSPALATVKSRPPMPEGGVKTAATSPPPLPPRRQVATQSTPKPPTASVSPCQCCPGAAPQTGVPWPAVFLHVVVSHRVVPLALFRDRASVAAASGDAGKAQAQHQLPFVHTNPCLGGRVCAGDRLFVVVPQDAEA